MGKPSIFSKEYDRRMKKRKARITIGVILVIIVFGVVFYKGYISNFIKDAKQKYEAEKVKKQEEASKSEEKPNIDANVNNENKASEQVQNKEEKYYEIKFPDGNAVKAVYEEENGVKKFKYLAPTEAKITFDLSMAAQGMVVCDEKTQNVMFCDINGTQKDITLKGYTSSTAGKTFPKDAILGENPNYIWSLSPKFISESQVVYISQLPYFGKEEKYLWIVDINDESRRMLNVPAKNISINSMTEKGLEVSADGVNKYIKADGSIVQ